MFCFSSSFYFIDLVLSFLLQVIGQNNTLDHRVQDLYIILFCEKLYVKLRF
ncbi:hypothetical protein I3842_02G015200 [Carya illinoinensis]|uniref:Photosystem II protein I n=1 Tax=Carya illinoinensis TaxID=32201 RepID=A0A922FLP5_CARIL|nr:hypothetical protein I3842_02G015200 [Carya illinoinensis]